MHNTVHLATDTYEDGIVYARRKKGDWIDSGNEYHFLQIISQTKRKELFRIVPRIT